MVFFTALFCVFSQVLTHDENIDNLATFVLNKSKKKHSSYNAKHSSYNNYEDIKSLDKPRSNTADGQLETNAIEAAKPTLDRKTSRLKFFGKSKSCENVLAKSDGQTHISDRKKTAQDKKAQEEKEWAHEILRAFEELPIISNTIGHINMLADQARECKSDDILFSLIKHNKNHLSGNDIQQFTAYITGFNQIQQLPQALSQNKTFRLTQLEKAFYTGMNTLDLIEHPTLKFYARFYSEHVKNQIYQLPNPPFGLSDDLKKKIADFKKFEKMNMLKEQQKNRLSRMDSQSIRNLIDEAAKYGKPTNKARS